MLVVGLGFTYFTLVDTWKEGKLSILQFMKEKSVSNPNYKWLRKGLDRVSERLEEFGVSVSPSRLFLGSSYSILQGLSVDYELNSIANWLDQSQKKPMDQTLVFPPISLLLVRAKASEKAGIRTKPTLKERFESLPLPSLYSLLVVIVILLEIALGRPPLIP